ncbi:MAG TPA: hypothetical protein VIH90_07990 [Candidatus Saccharimonadales bacterium]
MYQFIQIISRSSERLWFKYFGHTVITSEPITVAHINQYANGPTSTSQTTQPGNIYKPDTPGTKDQPYFSCLHSEEIYWIIIG